MTSSLFCQFLSFSQVFIVYIMHFISDFCSSGYYIPFSLPFSRIIAPQSLYCDWQLWYKNNHFFLAFHCIFAILRQKKKSTMKHLPSKSISLSFFTKNSDALLCHHAYQWIRVLSRSSKALSTFFILKLNLIPNN